jgi:hypothetical protein
MWPTSSTAYNEATMRVMPLKITVLAGVLLCIGVLEKCRCDRNELPWHFQERELKGNVAALVKRVGPPDQRYLAKESEVIAHGIAGWPVGRGEIGGAESREVLVMVWGRRCFFIRFRTMVAVVDKDTEEILFWQMYTRFGIPVWVDR